MCICMYTSLSLSLSLSIYIYIYIYIYVRMCLYIYIYIYIYMGSSEKSAENTYNWLTHLKRWPWNIPPKYTRNIRLAGGYISQVYFMGIFHTICGIIFLHPFGWNSSQQLAIFEDAQLAIIPCKWVHMKIGPSQRRIDKKKHVSSHSAISSRWLIFIGSWFVRLGLVGPGGDWIGCMAVGGQPHEKHDAVS